MGAACAERLDIQFEKNLKRSICVIVTSADKLPVQHLRQTF